MITELEEEKSLLLSNIASEHGLSEDLIKICLEGDIKEIFKHQDELRKNKYANELLTRLGYGFITAAFNKWYGPVLHRKLFRDGIEKIKTKVNHIKKLLFDGAREGSLSKVQEALAGAAKKGIDPAILINSEFMTAAQVARENQYYLLADLIEPQQETKAFKKPKRLPSREEIEEKFISIINEEAIQKYSPKIIRRRAQSKIISDKMPPASEAKAVATNLKIRKHHSMLIREGTEISPTGGHNPRSKNADVIRSDEKSNFSRRMSRKKRRSPSPKQDKQSRSPSRENRHAQLQLATPDQIEKEISEVHQKLIRWAHAKNDYSKIDNDMFSYRVFRGLVNSKQIDNFEDILLKLVIDNQANINERLWLIIDKRKLFIRFDELEHAEKINLKEITREQLKDKNSLLPPDLAAKAREMGYIAMALALENDLYTYIFDDKKFKRDFAQIASREFLGL